MTLSSFSLLKTPPRYLWLIVAVFAIAFFVRFWIYSTTDFIFDDAYIGARVAKNFANGFGLVYNAGDNAQTNTSFLFGLLWGLLWKAMGEISFNVSRITGAFVDSMTALGIAWLFLGGSLITHLGNKKRYFLAFAASFVYAVSAIAAIPAVGGFEPPYYTFLLVLVFIALQRGRFNVALLLAVLSVFMRPDGVIAAAITIVYILLKQRKITTSQMSIVFWGALVYGAMLLAIYGTLIPQSVIAKSLVQGHASEQWMFFLNKFYISRWALLPGLLSIIGIYQTIKHRKDLIPLFVWGLIYMFLFSSFGSWWAWYFPPFLVAYVLSIFIGIEYLAEKIFASRVFPQKIPAVIMSVLPVVIIVGFAVKSYTSITVFNKDAQKRWEKQVVMVTDWIKSNIPSDKNITLEAAGLFGLLLPQRVDDYPGLASRRMTAALADYQKRGGLPYKSHPEAWAYVIAQVKPYAIVGEKPILDALAKNDTIKQYEMRYACCPEIARAGEPGPYFVLVRKEENNTHEK